MPNHHSRLCTKHGATRTDKYKNGFCALENVIEEFGEREARSDVMVSAERGADLTSA